MTDSRMSLLCSIRGTSLEAAAPYGSDAWLALCDLVDAERTDPADMTTREMEVFCEAWWKAAHKGRSRKEQRCLAWDALGTPAVLVEEYIVQVLLENLHANLPEDLEDLFPRKDAEYNAFSIGQKLAQAVKDTQEKKAEDLTDAACAILRQNGHDIPKGTDWDDLLAYLATLKPNATEAA